MKGQLWQRCTKCRNEPVCCDCEKCKNHCDCGTPEPVDPGPAEPYRRGIGQGFGPGDDGDAP